MFIDGTELDRYFESAEGIVWVTGLVHVRDGKVLIDHFLVYPATGTRLTIGVRQMLRVVRALTDEAIAQGLSAYAVEADRVYAGKPERMISINRSLR